MAKRGQYHWYIQSWWGNALIVLVFSFAGGTASAFLMGLYLYLANRLFGMHDSEASSSLANPHFKNFTRMKIHDKGIDIYPVGIRKVQQNWKITGNGERITVSGEDFESFLIEPPIHIADSAL